jgi:hypothetical protein
MITVFQAILAFEVKNKKLIKRKENNKKIKKINLI